MSALYRCTCGEDVTAQIIRKAGDSPRPIQIVGTCTQGHRCFYEVSDHVPSPHKEKERSV